MALLKRRLGNGAFVLSSARQILDFRGARARLQLDQRTLDTTVSLFEVTKVAALGGMPLTPYARLDSGTLELCLLHETTRWRRLQLLLSLQVSDRHVYWPDVEYVSDQFDPAFNRAAATYVRDIRVETRSCRCTCKASLSVPRPHGSGPARRAARAGPAADGSGRARASLTGVGCASASLPRVRPPLAPRDLGARPPRGARAGAARPRAGCCDRARAPRRPTTGRAHGSFACPGRCTSRATEPVRMTLGPQLLGLRGLFRRLALDLVHVHAPLDPLLGLAAVLASPEFRHRRHVPRELPADAAMELLYGRLRPVTGRAFARLDVRIAVSEEARLSIAHYFKPRCCVIPNGVDVARFGPGGPAMPRPGRPTRPTILFVGRPDPRKGLPLLLAALGRVRRRLPAVRLLIVGTRPSAALRSIWTNWMPRRGRRRTWPGSGAQPLLPRYYATCDVFCSPATGQESQGVVCFEAMASARPVVAFDIPGYREVVARVEARAGSFHASTPRRSPTHSSTRSLTPRARDVWAPPTPHGRGPVRVAGAGGAARGGVRECVAEAPLPSETRARGHWRSSGGCCAGRSRGRPPPGTRSDRVDRSRARWTRPSSQSRPG